MTSYKPVIIQQDCPAHLIPVGTPVSLQAGQEVVIVQDLGGAYTLQVNGNLVRVDGQYAAALGLEPKVEQPTTQTFDKKLVDDGTVDEDSIWDQLKTCYDPEIPVNIVELGLIYECDIIPLFDEHEHLIGNKVYIEMTLTAPGCGMGPVLLGDVQQRVATVVNVTEVQVELVFDPPWDRNMMSEAAQLQLGML